MTQNIATMLWLRHVDPHVNMCPSRLPHFYAPVTTPNCAILG